MTERTFEEQVQLSSLHDIKAQGISIRVGNQIVKFVADETQDILVEDEVRNDFQTQYDAEYDKLKAQYDSLVKSTKEQAKRVTQELDSREKALRELARNTVQLPVLTESHIRQGLAVSRSGDGNNGYLWSFICIYAPKYVNDKVIDPGFANRMMTPMRIFINTDSSWKVTNVRLMKLINCEKFQHYHSTGSNRDCWGEMKYSGEVLDTPEKALIFIRRVQSVIETINRFSIGNGTPRGLPRLSTVEQHLLSERSDPQNNARGGDASKRNERAGFDATVNQEATADLWDVNG